MAEIAPEDLSAEVLTRFGNDDVAAQSAINAVLSSARRYCRWHVSPVRTGDVLTLDGTGGRVLDIPTGNLTALTGVTENASVVDVATLSWSKNGCVRKRSGACWSSWYQSIVATITHGYTEVEAADWRRAIIEMVGDVSLRLTDVDSIVGPLKRKKVDDVEYEWSESDLVTAADNAVYAVTSVLDGYQLPSVIFF